MASSSDCKTLLDSDPQIQALRAVGPWKRLSKRQAPDGVERMFQNKAGTCFVRVIEDAQGQVCVNQVGSSLAAVSVSDGSGAARASTGAGVGVVPTPGQLCLNIATDAQAIKDAKRFISELLAFREPDPAEDIGVAVANRMLFGVSGGCVDMSPPWIEDGAEGVMVSIVPDTYWQKKQCCFDQMVPIEGLLPNPELVESPNDTSDFLIHGQTDVYAATRLLLDAGFVWDESLQNFLDGMSPAPPGVVAWLKQGAPLRPGVVGRGPEAATPTPAGQPKIQQAQTATELEDAVKALGKNDVMVLVLDDAQQPLPPDFWQAAEKMCQVTNNLSRAQHTSTWTLLRVPPGCEIDVELRKQQPQFFGPPGPHVGHVSARGIAHSHHGSMEGMLVSPWKQMLGRYSKKKPRIGV